MSTDAVTDEPSLASLIALSMAVVAAANAARAIDGHGWAARRLTAIAQEAAQIGERLRARLIASGTEENG